MQPIHDGVDCRVATPRGVPPEEPPKQRHIIINNFPTFIKLPKKTFCPVPKSDGKVPRAAIEQTGDSGCTGE